MSFKQKIYTQCVLLLAEKISGLSNSLAELGEGAQNDAKSSAGDKHETAVAMMQIEQEKLGRQLNEMLEQRSVLEKIDITVRSPQITTGSLVTTNNGLIFICIALGKIIVDQKPVIAVSLRSPLGLKLAGLKTGDSAEVNGTKYNIERID